MPRKNGGEGKMMDTKLQDRESQIITVISDLMKVVNKVMDDSLRMALEIKEIRKQLNDSTRK